MRDPTKIISRAFVNPPFTNRVQMPMPREFNGKKYYGAADVAKILGVTQQTVSYWQNNLYMGAPLFTADERAHDGRYLYEVERVMQLKAVYRSNWTRGSYEPAHTSETLIFGQLPKENFDSEYLRLIKGDIAQAQAHLEELPESQRRGLTLDTYRHFGCGYLHDWILTKSRAEYTCGLYVKDDLTREPKHLPPSSPRIIIPTPSMEHLNGVATPAARLTMKKEFQKQHAGTMELFNPDALNMPVERPIVVVEGEFDAMSIWQCSGGKIAAVAILGCANWKKTLLPKLPALRGKKLLLLFDADSSGKKSAEKFLAELLNRGCLAVTKFLYDALPTDDQKFFGYKVDANEILKTRGDEYLNSLLEKIIADAAPNFDALADHIKTQNLFTQEQSTLPFVNGGVTTATQKKSSTRTTDENVDRDEIQRILKDFVHAKNITRDDWFKVGAILFRYGFTLEAWQEWSKDDSRYSAETCSTQWKSFKTSAELKGKGYTVATLIQIAKQFGYQPPRKTIVLDTQGDDHMTQDFIKDCPVNLRLPDNYIFNNGGIILVVPPKKDNDEPKYIRAVRTPIIPTKIFREPTKNKFSYEIAILTRNVWRTAEIEGRTLADPRAIITLADSGALIDEPKILCRFLNAVIALNPALQEIKAYNQTGWTDDTFKTFAYPGVEGCILRRAGFDFDRDLSKRGDAELWKQKLVEVLNKGGAVAAMYIGTALAAIIARPLNIMNPQAHLHGTSGGGKTALQKFTASIFGNPRELLRNFAATNKNRQLVSAAFCDLPTFYDELETLQGKAAEEQLSNDVYNFADGKGNQANKRDGTARETFRFGGARLTTGERPILKDNDLRGAYKRLIQLCIQGQLFDDNFAADLHIFSESDFGHFGYQWIQYATEHFDEIQKHYQHYAACNNPTLKIFEPTHLKSVTAALVAVEFFKVMLGINAKFDEDGAFIRNRRVIVDHYLPTLTDLDDTIRAIDAMRSYVSSHEKSFIRDETDTDTNKPVEIGAWGTVCSGKIFDIGAVAIFPTELKRILEDELHFASADKLINEWCQQGVLIPDKKQRTRVIKIDKKPYRVYFFKAGAIACANDSVVNRQLAN